MYFNFHDNLTLVYNYINNNYSFFSGIKNIEIIFYYKYIIYIYNNNVFIYPNKY